MFLKEPRYFLFYFFFVYTVSLSGQTVGLGKFNDHLPYNEGNSLCISNNKIYVTSGKGLFTYDLDDNSIETLSKVNKLSDLGTKSIAYSKKHNVIIIGYSTGNIDIIENNQVINMPDIKRTSIQGFKYINDIYLKEDYAFLSTGFGIVKLDIQRQEIKETFLIGENGTNVDVKDLTFFNDTIYAATKSGIYVAPENSPNLSDFQNWEKLSRHSESTINTIESNDSVLLLNITTAAQTGPIKLPLPTSSTPATIFFIKNLILFHRFLLLFFLNQAKNIFSDRLVLINMRDGRLSLQDMFCY